MTETLERVDVLEAAPVVVDVDDYLDVREPAWAVLEARSAVKAREGKVYVNAELLEVLAALSRAFPTKYPPHAQPI
jgi:hypothetical protein